jgi:hypothetical protein
MLALPYLNFNQLFMHDIGLNFGYVIPFNISNFLKNPHKFWSPKMALDNFHSSLNQLNI